MDTYQGNGYDPITLHKYLYANANPVMFTDPSGYMSMVSVSTAQSAMGNLMVRSIVVLDRIQRVVDTVGFAYSLGQALRTLSNGDFISTVTNTYDPSKIDNPKFKRLLTSEGMREAASVFSNNSARIMKGVLKHKRSELSKAISNEEGKFVLFLPSFRKSKALIFPTAIKVPVPKFGSKPLVVLVGGKAGRAFGLGTQLKTSSSRNQLFRMDWHDPDQHFPGDLQNHDFWEDEGFHFHIPK